MNRSIEFLNSCKLSDIDACAENEACVQNQIEDNESGACICLEGYLRNENHVSRNYKITTQME